MMPHSRREFLTRAGQFAAGASLSAPALANLSPEIRWTMASAFQPSLDVIYGGAKTCAAAVSEMTDGNFAITVQPSGAIGPAIDALDAVADRKARAAPARVSAVRQRCDRSTLS